jgi:hypothetical protein
MHQKKENLLVVSVIVSSVLTAFYLFDVNYFPNTSIAFLFFLLASAVYALKQNRTGFHTAVYTLILLLCFFLLVRSSHITTALNVFVIVFLGSILSITNKAEERLINLVASPILVVAQTIRESNSFKLRLRNESKSTSVNHKDKLIESISVAVISLITLVTISILLGSANQQLGNFLQTVVSLFKLERLLNFLGPYLRIERIVVAVFLSVMTLKYLSFIKLKGVLPKPHKVLDRKLDLRIPLLIACILITVFFIFQIDSNFTSNESLSKQTNDIFAQLSAVCVVVFILLLNNKTKDKLYNTVKIILYFQLVYLIIFALKSDITYIREWGLTHKRLYGLVVITWVLGMYGLYVKYMDKTQITKKFYELGIIFTALLLIVVNMLNFDYLIYKYKPSTHTRPIDHDYLSKLSADTGLHQDHIHELWRTQSSSESLDTELNFIMQLQEKYDTFDIRVFNYSEYLQYKNIKNMYSKNNGNTLPPLKPE